MFYVVYPLTLNLWCYRVGERRVRSVRVHPLIRAGWAWVRLFWPVLPGTRYRHLRRVFYGKHLSTRTKCPTRTSRRTFGIEEVSSSQTTRRRRASSRRFRDLGKWRMRCSSTPLAFPLGQRLWPLRSELCNHRCTSPTSNTCRYLTPNGEDNDYRYYINIYRRIDLMISNYLHERNGAIGITVQKSRWKISVRWSTQTVTGRIPNVYRIFFSIEVFCQRFIISNLT